MYHIKELNALKKEELEAIALKQNLMKLGDVIEKEDIVYKILTAQAQKEAKEMSEKGKQPKSTSHRNNIIIWMWTKNDNTFFCRKASFRPFCIIGIWFTSRPSGYSML